MKRFFAVSIVCALAAPALAQDGRPAILEPWARSPPAGGSQRPDAAAAQREP
jgi:hypothetical protein